MIKSKSTSLGVTKSMKRGSKVNKTSVANVNKGVKTRSATDLEATTPKKRRSTNTNNDVNMPVKKDGGKQLKTVGKSLQPCTSLKIQEKYVNASVPNITIRGSQVFVEGREEPIDMGPENMVETTYRDGDKVIKLTVDPNDSFAADSDDEQDHEMNDSGSYAGESSDEDTDSEVEIAVAEDPVKNDLNDSDQIDLQVSQRIQELSELIKTGGFEHSRKVLQDCFGTPGGGKSVRRKSTRGTVLEKIKQI